MFIGFFSLSAEFCCRSFQQADVAKKQIINGTYEAIVINTDATDIKAGRIAGRQCMLPLGLQKPSK
jgi:hypothetical protein